MLAWKELLTCQFCFQEQAKESRLRKVLSGAHLIRFELLEHCLYQQHLQHTCHCTKKHHPRLLERATKKTPQYEACTNMYQVFCRQNLKLIRFKNKLYLTPNKEYTYTQILVYNLLADCTPNLSPIYLSISQI